KPAVPSKRRGGARVLTLWPDHCLGTRSTSRRNPNMYDSQAPAADFRLSETMAQSEFSALESPSGVISAHDLLDDAEPSEGALALELEPMPEAVEPVMLPASMHGVIGLSESLVEVYRVIDRVADTNCTILITGDSGTGKELVARAVHRTSPRAPKGFVAVNCGAIP